MRKYIVFTPSYELRSAYAPPETGSDVVEVEATTRVAALVLGLRELRRMHSHWVADRESDNRCPFVGLKAEEVEHD